jgi:hypothetical protein
VKSFLAQSRKAIGVAIAGLSAWVYGVIDSSSVKITSAEWKQLIAVGVATLACYGLTNDDKPPTFTGYGTPD